ncbi:phytanoyl-CoA dioxygenase family protein [Streptomyces sp. BE20]|uniref:phytanoyl-CoA dioxygenase family protein n=1 Tax=unclassified Streptomyces TaxID=2593676 RepID=UPI002E7721A3|nr:MULTISPECIES: phytanoyl-CoA dioxygenase family protein [unclassified Streptomyces]MED7952410.1 phytanoyl-CoA dioxygenase family protein [Streptomyces sp. BE303]MEE1828068.1 phytanoyl-CoA dioxygenase family protein [Streptomyces sp. BE20]
MSIGHPTRTPPGGLTSNGYRLDGREHRLGRLEPVPDTERLDREALTARLDRDGYLYLPGFFERSTIEAFRTYYFTVLSDCGLIRPGSDPAEGLAAPAAGVDRARLRHLLFQQVVPGPQYEDLCRNPDLVAFHRWFLGAGAVHLHRRKIIRHVGPGESGIGTATQAHYDLVYLREGTDRVMSSWIPLGDCPISRGPLIYLEGSHRRVLAEEAAGRLRRPAAPMAADLPALAEQYDTRWLVTDFAAGDLMVHSPYVIHASLDNHDPAGRFRLSTDIRFQAADDALDARWQNHWHDQDGL